MDMLAHALWAAAGVQTLRRSRPLRATTVAAAAALAVLPDLLHALPIAGWIVHGGGNAGALADYALARPGAEPAVPTAVALASHHLHCIGHSALVAAAVHALLWWRLRATWWPLLGWWSHIVIDVFTHSADFYPSPVLYPITQRGFDGLAWTTPWFQVLNYAALAVLWGWLLRRRRGGARS